MKKLFLISCACNLLILFVVEAQIPNSDFENWTTTSYNQPDGWNSGNQQTIQRMNVVPITRVTGHSGYGIRIQTTINATDTSSSYISNSYGDPIAGEGGVPYSQQATAVTGYYRYSLPGNDTALLLVIFKKNASIVSFDIIKIKGTGSQPNFTPFSFPLTLAVVPDSVIIASASSNLISNEGVSSGSFLELDGLGFAGTSQALPDGEFENWTPSSYDVAAGWEMLGEGVSQTTESYSGLYAMRMETIDYGGGNIGSSGITTGHQGNNGTQGGQPFSNAVDTLTGYYKYITVNADTANATVALMSNGLNIGWFGTYLPATSVYTYFEIPISSGNIPDTMRIDFYSSQWPYTQSSIGSVLYVDNLALKSTLALGISKQENGKALAPFAYPNPVSDQLNIITAKKLSGQVWLNLYDFSGRLIEQTPFNGAVEQYRVNVSGLTKGAYYYELVSSEGSSRNKFIKE